MKKSKLFIIVVAVVILVVGGLALLKNFIIGDVKDVSSIAVSNMKVTEKNVFFDVVFVSSADVMKGYQYRIEGNVMYIKIKSVLVGGFGKSHVDIQGNFSSLQKVIIKDKKEQKTIWET